MIWDGEGRGGIGLDGVVWDGVGRDGFGWDLVLYLDGIC